MDPEPRDSTLQKVFCPKCGAPFVEEAGHLVCDAGDMQLAQRVQDLVTSMCLSDPMQPEALPGRTRSLGGTWYCPSDATPMEPAEGYLPTCPRCRRSLTWSIAWQLIERHPHRNRDWPSWPSGSIRHGEGAPPPDMS
jgi:hypothetical protein